MYAKRTACWRTRTGCRCRNTLFITAYARDRSSSGYGLRKIDRQTGTPPDALVDPLEETHLAPPATPAVPASWASRYDSL